MIPLTVKTLDNRDHHFEVDDEITVREFKEHIADGVLIAADVQRLIYCGRVLNDESKLKDLNVRNKVVHLVERPPPLPAGTPRARSPTPPTPTNRTFFNPPPNAVYLGAMTYPPMNEVREIPQPVPTNRFTSSRLNVAFRMMRNAEIVIQALEQPDVIDDARMIRMLEEMEESTPFYTAEVIVTPNQFVEDVQDALTNINPQDVLNFSEVTNVLGNLGPQTASDASNAAAGNSNTGRQNVPAASSDTSGNNPPIGASSTPHFASILNYMIGVQARFRPFYLQYMDFMSEDPEINPQDENTLPMVQSMLDKVSQVLHFLAHAYHAMSDIICNVDMARPRHLLCRPVFVQHTTVVQTEFPVQLEALIDLDGGNLVRSAVSSTAPNTARSTQTTVPASTGQTGSDSRRGSRTTLGTTATTATPVTTTTAATPTSAPGTAISGSVTVTQISEPEPITGSTGFAIRHLGTDHPTNFISLLQDGEDMVGDNIELIMEMAQDAPAANVVFASSTPTEATQETTGSSASSTTSSRRTSTTTATSRGRRDGSNSSTGEPAGGEGAAPRTVIYSSRNQADTGGGDTGSVMEHVLNTLQSQTWVAYNTSVPRVITSALNTALGATLPNRSSTGSGRTAAGGSGGGGNSGWRLPQAQSSTQQQQSLPVYEQGSDHRTYARQSPRSQQNSGSATPSSSGSSRSQVRVSQQPMRKFDPYLPCRSHHLPSRRQNESRSTAETSTTTGTTTMTTATTTGTTTSSTTTSSTSSTTATTSYPYPIPPDSLLSATEYALRYANALAPSIFHEMRRDNSATRPQQPGNESGLLTRESTRHRSLPLSSTLPGMRLPNDNVLYRFNRGQMTRPPNFLTPNPATSRTVQSSDPNNDRGLDQFLSESENELSFGTLFRRSAGFDYEPDTSALMDLLMIIPNQLTLFDLFNFVNGKYSKLNKLLPKLSDVILKHFCKTRASVDVSQPEFQRFLDEITFYLNRLDDLSDDIDVPKSIRLMLSKMLPDLFNYILEPFSSFTQDRIGRVFMQLIHNFQVIVRMTIVHGSPREAVHNALYSLVGSTAMGVSLDDHSLRFFKDTVLTLIRIVLEKTYRQSDCSSFIVYKGTAGPASSNDGDDGSGTSRPPLAVADEIEAYDESRGGGGGGDADDDDVDDDSNASSGAMRMDVQRDPLSGDLSCSIDEEASRCTATLRRTIADNQPVSPQSPTDNIDFELDDNSSQLLTHSADDLQIPEILPGLNSAEIPDLPEPQAWHNGLPQNWAPVIHRDRVRQRKLEVSPRLSEAYLNGMPTKRRRMYRAQLESSSTNAGTTAAEAAAGATSASGTSAAAGSSSSKSKY